jgi:hypothetical protein
VLKYILRLISLSMLDLELKFPYNCTVSSNSLGTVSPRKLDIVTNLYQQRYRSNFSYHISVESKSKKENYFLNLGNLVLISTVPLRISHVVVLSWCFRIESCQGVIICVMLFIVFRHTCTAPTSITAVSSEQLLSVVWRYTKFSTLIVRLSASQVAQ